MQHRILALALLALGTLWSAQAAAQDCPQRFKHERDDVLYPSPRERLAKNKVKDGRVCVDIVVIPQGKRRGANSVCPAGYSKERAGIFYESPRKRLSPSYTVENTEYCVAILKPSSGELGANGAAEAVHFDTLDDASLTGAPLGATQTNTSAQCASRCAAHGFCAAWTWRENKQCSLLLRAEKATFASGARSGVSSAYLKQRVQSGSLRDFAYDYTAQEAPDTSDLYAQNASTGLPPTARQLSKKARDSRDVCRQSCDAQQSCRAFSYDAGSKQCTLYDIGAFHFEQGVPAGGATHFIRRTKSNPNPPTKKSAPSGDKA